MQLNLKLFPQVLILVCVPLAMELVFTASLYLQVQEVEAQAAREHKAHEAYASLNSLYERVGEISKLVGMYVVLRKSGPGLAFYHELVSIVPQDIANLRVQLQGKPDAIAKLDELDAELAVDLHQINEVFALMESGDRIAAMQRLRQLKSVPHLLELLGDMRGECEQDAYESFEVQQRARSLLANYLRFGIAANIVVAVLLAVIVNRGIVTRLSVVMQNTKRLATGLALLPAVSGRDEIAHLDQVFKEMALALEMAHKKERAVIDTMPAGLVITDSSGNIQMINPAAVALSGFSFESLQGRNLAVLFAGEKGTEPQVFLADIIARSRHRIEERVVMTAGGKALPVEISMTSFAVFDDEFYLFVMLDITERKEMERWKQEFASMVSHDLRTPLTSIQVFLNMLCKGMFGDVSEAIEKKAAMADRNASRLIGLINDLLDIERMESGQLSLNRQDISVAKVIEMSFESVRSFADQRGILLESAGTTKRLINADCDRLVQVMVNLLGNALKFSPKDSRVVVVVEDLALAVNVKVIDQGRGVPEHLINTIFERFKQVEVADATQKHGTGLGLAICKAVIEQHGGTIGLESGQDKGSTFWFNLPFSNPTPDLPAKVASSVILT